MKFKIFCARSYVYICDTTVGDLCFFHKIVHDYVPIKLPNYVIKYRGNSRLRNKHLDSDCYVCDLKETGISKSNSPIFRNFFYRITFLWNSLPRDVRTISSTHSFKSQVKQFLWKNAQTNTETYQT